MPVTLKVRRATGAAWTAANPVLAEGEVGLNLTTNTFKIGDGVTHWNTLAQSFAVVENGNSHDHVGGDGAQIDHGGLAGLSDDDHTQYIKHSLAGAANDFLVASGAGAFVKKTLAETKTILGVGAAGGTDFLVVQVFS